jgi:hypothetical protein
MIFGIGIFASALALSKLHYDHHSIGSFLLCFSIGRSGYS